MTCLVTERDYKKALEAEQMIRSYWRRDSNSKVINYSKSVVDEEPTVKAEPVKELETRSIKRNENY